MPYNYKSNLIIKMDIPDNRSAVRRPTVSYEDKCSRFKFDGEKQDYERQFNDLYHARLDSLRPRVIKAAAKMWGPDVPVRKLTDLYDNKDNCVIIGTIYKLQEMKPSVLKEIAAEANITAQPVRAMKFTSEDDKCILEDESLRVNLTGPHIDHGALVTGVTVGVFGWQEEGGSFEVNGICFVEPPPLPYPVSATLDTAQEDRYVLLISGLNFSGDKEGDDSDVSRVIFCSLLTDWITGNVGDEEEISKIQKIVRVVIAGGSISEKCHRDSREYAQAVKFRARKTAPPSVEAVRLFDDFLCNIAASINVDLMPGEFDPTNHMLPQQPWHKCLLPKSTQCGTLNQCTNPYAAEIDGVNFLGTSGQNTDDILKYSSLNSGMEALESTLKWSHLCPTAPDTLSCYPYYHTDPFIIENELPHVYFVGNQPEFGWKIVDHEHLRERNEESDRKTILISIPKFSDSGICVLVNLRNLEVEPIVFAADEFFQGAVHTNGTSDMSVDMDYENDSRLSTPVVVGTPDLFS